MPVITRNIGKRIKTAWKNKKYPLVPPTIRRRLQIAFNEPLDIGIEITRKCNYKCSMCSHYQDRKNGMVMKDISMDTFSLILDQIKNIKTRKKVVINLGGYGEPLMNKNMPVLIKKVKTAIPNPHVRFHTNVYFLTKQKGKELIEAGPDHIWMSINGPTRDDYLKLMNLDYYDRVIENAKMFLKTREELGNNIEVVLQIFDMFSEKTEHFKSIFQEWLCDKVKVFTRPLLSIDHKDIEKEDILKKVGKDEGHVSRCREPCRQLVYSIRVDLEGNIYPCCKGMWCTEGLDLIIGNIYSEGTEKSLKNKRRLDEFHNQRKNVYGKVIKGCDKCDMYALSSSGMIYSKILNRWV